MPTLQSPPPATERPPLPELRLHSELLQDVLERPPTWMTRWGLTLVLGLLLLIIGGCYLIQYPDVVTVPMRLTTNNAPKTVQTRMAGRLSKLLIGNNAPVVAGQPVAFLESTADHAQVLRLQDWLTQLDTVLARPDTPLGGDPAALRLPTGITQLGEIQQQYQEFDKARQRFLTFTAGNFYRARKQLLLADMQNLRALQAGLQQQQALQTRDLALAEQELATNSTLLESKAISALDYKREESKCLAKRMAREQANLALLNNHSLQLAKQAEILEVNNLFGEQRDLFAQARLTFRSAIAAWCRSYIVTAPLAGTLYFTSFLQENQGLTAQQELFTVVPAATGAFGEVRIPQHSLAKVRAGQVVVIKLSSFPFEEYGTLNGRITYISPVAQHDGTFLAKVDFGRRPVTSRGTRLVLRSGMLATAEIITENSRLLEKIYYRTIAAVRRK